MSLCIMNRLSGAGKIRSLRDLLQRIISYSKQPMVPAVAVDTAEMEVMEKMVDPAESDVKMGFCSMLEEILQEFRMHEKMKQRRRELKRKLSIQYRAMDIQKCIDTIKNELLLDIEGIEGSFQKCPGRFFRRSVHGRNAKIRLESYIELLEKVQNSWETPNQTGFGRRITEPN